MEDDVSEKVRKRQSVENVKKKQNKRSKMFTKEESISMKKVKVVILTSNDDSIFTLRML